LNESSKVVTDADGNVLQRPYLGEDRFVLLLGRYLYGTGDLEYTDVARLIPRSIFFQSELYHRTGRTRSKRLRQGDNRPATP
jgi:homogentisate 1,2-dioxygenase